MSTALLRRKRFGGYPLPIRTIVILENNRVTPDQLRVMTALQLQDLGLNQHEANAAIVAAQRTPSP